MNNELSFFIIGMPRSGTKLLRGLLNNHFRIFIPDIETLFVPKLIRKYGIDEKLSEIQISRIINELKNSVFFFYYLKTEDFDFSSLSYNNYTLRDILNSFYKQLAMRANKEDSIYGDKSPNYIYDLNVLSKCFTGAKFIHIVRDPRDYALSVNKAWGKNIYRAAYKWSIGVESVRVLKNTMNDNVYEVKYEELLLKPVETLKGICGFLGLEYYSRLVKLEKDIEVSKYKRSDFIYHNNFNKYINELNSCQIKLIEEITVEPLRYYNYELVNYDVQKRIPIKPYRYYWSFIDAINLFEYNIHQHGVYGGSMKIIKAISDV